MHLKIEKILPFFCSGSHTISFYYYYYYIHQILLWNCQDRLLFIFFFFVLFALHFICVWPNSHSNSILYLLLLFCVRCRYIFIYYKKWNHSIVFGDNNNNKKSITAPRSPFFCFVCLSGIFLVMMVKMIYTLFHNFFSSQWPSVNNRWIF